MISIIKHTQAGKEGPSLMKLSDWNGKPYNTKTG